MVNNPTNSPTIASRKVAIICSDGVSEAAVKNLKNALKKEDAKGYIVAPRLGSIKTDSDRDFSANFSFLTASSVLFDAVYIPHGLDLTTLEKSDEVIEFLNDAYKHCKVIGADGKASKIISNSPFVSQITDYDPGIVITDEIASTTFAQDFITAMTMHRFWQREKNLYN